MPRLEIDAEAQFKRWRRYCRANGRRYADWNAGWEDWLDKPAARPGRNGNPGEPNPYDTGAGARLRREQEAIVREDAARTPEEREAALERVRTIVNGVHVRKVVEPNRVEARR